MYTKPIDWILSRLWRTAVILCWLYKCTYVNSGAQILLTPSSLQDLSQCIGLYPRWLNYTSIITNNCILFIHAKNKEMWKGKLSAASLLNSIILRERTAIPDIKVVIACWMGAEYWTMKLSGFCLQQPLYIDCDSNWYSTKWRLSLKFKLKLVKIFIWYIQYYVKPFLYLKLIHHIIHGIRQHAAYSDPHVFTPPTTFLGFIDETDNCSCRPTELQL